MYSNFQTHPSVLFLGVAAREFQSKTRIPFLGIFFVAERLRTSLGRILLFRHPGLLGSPMASLREWSWAIATCLQTCSNSRNLRSTGPSPPLAHPSTLPQTFFECHKSSRPAATAGTTIAWPPAAAQSGSQAESQLRHLCQHQSRRPLSDHSAASLTPSIFPTSPWIEDDLAFQSHRLFG